MNCEVCGEADSMPYTCSRCGETYCVSHRLPEYHECTGLAVDKANREMLRAEGEEVPWFEKGSGKALTEDSATASRNSKMDLWPDKILLLLIISIATLGAGYFTLSLIGVIQ
ncbi:AN1-type zinc finger domain-containing protein [Halorubrum sp. DTA46]|uniref:AN1-type zinc finger domain-containing protein n=1 Tax=Halorubrum sp. DTA46 TaxID=3402162 RepID=UPI003AB04A3A